MPRLPHEMIDGPALTMVDVMERMLGASKLGAKKVYICEGVAGGWRLRVRCMTLEDDKLHIWGDSYRPEEGD